MKLYFLLLLIIPGLSSISQTSSGCPEKIIYYTVDIGNGVDKMAMPLKFKITKDSIIAVMESAFGGQEGALFELGIVTSECKWDKNLVNGSSEYNIILKDDLVKKGVVKITKQQGKGKIELVYENMAEPRVFNLKE